MPEPRNNSSDTPEKNESNNKMNTVPYPILKRHYYRCHNIKTPDRFCQFGEFDNVTHDFLPRNIHGVFFCAMYAIAP